MSEKTPQAKIAAKYKELTEVVSDLYYLYEEHDRDGINGRLLPVLDEGDGDLMDVSTCQVLPCSIDDWLCRLRSHDEAMEALLEIERANPEGDLDELVKTQREAAFARKDLRQRTIEKLTDEELEALGFVKRGGSWRRPFGE